MLFYLLVTERQTKNSGEKASFCELFTISCLHGIKPRRRAFETIKHVSLKDHFLVCPKGLSNMLAFYLE